MSLKKRPGGDAWIGAEVEVYWETTKKWESGKVVAYQPIRDEYKVRQIKFLSSLFCLFLSLFLPCHLNTILTSFIIIKLLQ